MRSKAPQSNMQLSDKGASLHRKLVVRLLDYLSADEIQET